MIVIFTSTAKKDKDVLLTFSKVFQAHVCITSIPNVIAVINNKF